MSGFPVSVCRVKCVPFTLWVILGLKVGGDDGWLFWQFPGGGISSWKAAAVASEVLLVCSVGALLFLLD